MEYLWSDLKLLFTVILSVVLINLLFFGILFSIYKYDTNNANKQVVDYDTYVQDTFNINLNRNTQVIEEEKDNNAYITYETLPDSNYELEKVNPFSNS